MGPAGAPQSRDALSLRGVPMVGALAAGEAWALSGGILVPTAIPAAANVQTLLNSLGSTRGMILRRGAALWETLGAGIPGQVLTSNGTEPGWATPSSYTPTAPTTPGPVAFLLSGNQTISSASATDVGSSVSLANATSKAMLVQGSFSLVGYGVADTLGATFYTSTNDGTTTAQSQLLYVDIYASTYRQIAVLPFAVVIPASTTGSVKCRAAISPAEPNFVVNAANSYCIYSKSYF